MNQLQEKITATKGGQNLVRILGPIIGALPGVLIFILVSSLGRISILSSLVIIYGAIAGYNWSKTPLRLPGFLYIFFINIIMTFLGVVLSVWVEGISALCSEYGWDSLISMATLVVPDIILHDPDIQQDIFANTIIGLIPSLPAGLFLYFTERKKQHSPFPYT